ncbi:MAG: 1-acyl-sn-glycerol-3-phosphate acyltransferase [Bacteroidota bacterium]
MIPTLGDAAPRRGNVFSRGFGRFVLFACGRWRIVGELPNEPRFLLVVAPHTSNWDGLIGLASAVAIGLRVRFLAKHTLFRGPLGWLLRLLEGIPVKRGRSGHLVEDVVDLFEREEFVLAVTPEGTRKQVDRWRTGFYHIAHRAQVPLFMIALDYPTREVRLGPLVRTNGDMNGQIDFMRDHFATIDGKNPEYA